MAATFTWKITNLEHNNSDGGVVVVHWRVDATEGEFTASSYGSLSFTPDPSDSGFVALSDLTEETVLGWVFDPVPKEWTEEALQLKLDEMMNPKTSSGLPWVS
jgi:hypothetical protein